MLEQEYIERGSNERDQRNCGREEKRIFIENKNGKRTEKTCQMLIQPEIDVLISIIFNNRILVLRSSSQVRQKKININQFSFNQYVYRRYHCPGYAYRDRTIGQTENEP